MKNIVLDFMMGLLCVILTLTLFGILFIPDVLREWRKMRIHDEHKDKRENEL